MQIYFTPTYAQVNCCRNYTISCRSTQFSSTSRLLVWDNAYGIRLFKRTIGHKFRTHVGFGVEPMEDLGVGSFVTSRNKYYGVPKACYSSSLPELQGLHRIISKGRNVFTLIQLINGVQLWKFVNG
ncbi:hypothetical protein J6590_051961 [Homalodisca vitripennis]|nr:hypothetical protein J6590_051961 [Homalodisca vitripennis]